MMRAAARDPENDATVRAISEAYAEGFAEGGFELDSGKGAIRFWREDDVENREEFSVPRCSNLYGLYNDLKEG